MSDFAPNTRSDVPTTRKCLSTSKALLDNLKIASSVIEEYHPIDSASIGIEDVKVDFFAEGGYNYLWLVSFSSKPSGVAGPISSSKVILREPNDDALLPWQIENEVAHLTFIAKNHPSIPVPKVYAYDTGQTGNEPFILMEYIDGQPLSTAWTTYTEDEKWAAARQVAQIIVEMSEITSQRIGGLTLKHETGPTVEGMKLFKGRDNFHSPDCYDIGPYDSTQAYVLACYDKEIYYYSHAPNSDLDESLSDSVARGKFVKTLQETRDRLALSTSTFLPEEPFTLVHNDINGRNIMMRDKKIVAVIDWEFAGSYPLSEMLGGRGVDLLEMVDSETEEECSAWSVRVEELVAVAARAKGWDEQKVELLVGAGNDELGLARMEMLPDWIFDDEEPDDGAKSDGEDNDAGLS